MLSMAYDFSRHESNPWQKFTLREEKIHQAEDKSRLFPSHQIPSADVIEGFLRHQRDELDILIPRRYQALRNYLSHAIRNPSNVVENDIAQSSSNRDIVLLDDRQNHVRCVDACRQWHGQRYKGCNIFSDNLSIPAMFSRLKEEVS